MEPNNNVAKELLVLLARYTYAGKNFFKKGRKIRRQRMDEFSTAN